MAAISLKVFKKGKPIYWIIGAVVLFVLFYFMFNRGGGAATASGSTNYVTTGPSEAVQIASMQAGAAAQAGNLAASVEMARINSETVAAGLGAQIAMAQLASGENVALRQLIAQERLGEINAETNLLINEQNLSYSTETARIAADTNIALKNIDAGILTSQLTANRDMFAIQSSNMITQTLISQVGNLKKRDRDDALAGIGGYIPVYGGSGGGISGSDIAPFAGVIGSFI